MIKRAITNSLILVTVLIGFLILISCNDQSAKDSLATAKEKGYLNYEVLNDSVVYHYIYRSGINWYKGEAASFTVREANPKTFIELTGNYAKDSLHVFHKGHKLSEIDVNSFKVIAKFLTRDKLGVYLENKKITNSDGLSFRFINDNYAIDNNQIYHFSSNDYSVIKNVDRESFTPIDNLYAKDKKHVYYLDIVITNADPVTFRVLDSVLKKGTDFIDAEDNTYFYSKEKSIKK